MEKTNKVLEKLKGSYENTKRKTIMSTPEGDNGSCTLGKLLYYGLDVGMDMAT